MNGLLFDPDHPGSLRDHVDALVGDPALRAGVGEGGERATRSRSWPELTAALVGHYSAAIDRRALSPAG